MAGQLVNKCHRCAAFVRTAAVRVAIRRGNGRSEQIASLVATQLLGPA
jgi:hypothetical protein